MSNSIAIQVENLSKAYQLGQIGTGTISRDLERFVVIKLLRKEDPFLKIGQTNDRTIKGESDIVWSLKGINFDIQQGDAVGVIGRNGAGKSTLLKLLSRVTSPTAGSIKVKGRIASLLEVGTGFHPELSGRENIFLNGAILGMRKAEIKRKLDEIVDFAGVERYIDTPVKRYSSGMYVRLAFAVAAHLESEILIVDEVLAVGDAEFQKKCLGKMGDISKGEGRTVLFVSHNMAAVNSLCNKGILLENGKVTFDGIASDCIEKYLLSSNLKEKYYLNTKVVEKGIQSVAILNKERVLSNELIQIEIKSFDNIIDVKIGIAVLDSNNQKIFTTINKVKTKTNSFVCEIPNDLLVEGNYSLDVAIFDDLNVYDYVNEICYFEVIEIDSTNKDLKSNSGKVKVNCRWI